MADDGGPVSIFKAFHVVSFRLVYGIFFPREDSYEYSIRSLFDGCLYIRK